MGFNTAYATAKRIHENGRLEITANSIDDVVELAAEFIYLEKEVENYKRWMQEAHDRLDQIKAIVGH